MLEMNLQIYFYLITISSTVFYSILKCIVFKTFYSIKKCIDKQSKGILKNPVNLSEEIQ